MVKDEKSEGEVKLGPLTICFPDVSLDTFWFMQDLCEILGVEYNSEAQARLEGALRGKMRGLDPRHCGTRVSGLGTSATPSTPRSIFCPGSCHRPTVAISGSCSKVASRQSSGASQTA